MSDPRPPFDEAADATPLTPDERDGLVPTHITLRGELNELEQGNILDAEDFAFSRRRDPLDEVFGRSLHRRMFSQVWKWAGHYRTTNKNIGVERTQIVPRLYQVYDDARYQLAHAIYPHDEIATRFHHGLVYVHPFPNGNGRWSRLMADILLVRHGQRRFSAGARTEQSTNVLRSTYIAALRQADANDFRALVTFMQS